MITSIQQLETLAATLFATIPDESDKRASCKKPGDLSAWYDKEETAINAAYMAMIKEMLASRAAGDAFAEAFCLSFGDLQFEEDGEEFGHYRTATSDEAVVAKAQAMSKQAKKAGLADLAGQ